MKNATISLILASIFTWFISFVASSYKTEAKVENLTEDVKEIKTDVKEIKKFLMEKN